uniref:Reverse transcriptase domain-containing protein n=1 Tax=Tanacetum cinerariifolium TaxID=118510 RepID=A0A699HH59_TANCI|nr:hypothetical protein [Tanacetum cinerariifolium]
MARMDAMTMKMDAQYKYFQSRLKSNPDHNDDDIPMSREEEAKFMQTFRRTRFYNDYRDCDLNRDNWRSSGRNGYNRANYQSHSDDKPNHQKQLSDFIITQHSDNSFIKDNFMDLKNKLETTTKNHQAPIQNLKAKFDIFADKQSGDDKDDEPKPQPKPKTPKPVKETPIPKHYKPKIPYPQRLRKEKIEAQYGKFLNMIRAVRINVPLVDVLDGMPNYGKFLKELVNNKQKIKQMSTAFLSNESSAILQNKAPPKLGDTGSFLIPFEVGKFTFPADFVILEMEEDSKVPLILGRPFIHTANAIIRVKQKQLNLGVRTERMIFHIDSAMKHSHSNDDTCFSIDVIDKILEEDLDALLDEGSEILHSVEGNILEEKLFAEFDEFIAMTADENSKSKSDTKVPPFEKITFNTDYKIKTSLEEPPMDLELKPLPDNPEYVFLEEPYFLPVIISSQLSKENKNKLYPFLKDTNKPLLGKLQTFLESVHLFEISTSVFLMVFSDIFKYQSILWTKKKQRSHVLLVHTLRRMPFSLCNAPATFQSPFDHCLNNLYKMLQLCKDAHLALNWEKCHFIVKEGIVLGHKVSEAGLEVDKAKIEAISKLPPPLISKAFRTAYKTPTGTTPYKLVYGKNCHLPFKIKHHAYWALKNCNPNLIAAGEK